MQVQNRIYYIPDVNEKARTLSLRGENTKPEPLATHLARYTLNSLYLHLIERNFQLNNVKSAEVKRIANEILNGYEYKMGVTGRLWDCFKQFLGYNTERKQLTALHNRIIVFTDVINLPSSDELRAITQKMSSLEEEMKGIEYRHSHIFDVQKTITSLEDISHILERSQPILLHHYYEIATILTDHVRLAVTKLYWSTNLDSDQSKILRGRINELESLIHPLCIKIGNRYLKNDQLEHLLTAAFAYGRVDLYYPIEKSALYFKLIKSFTVLISKLLDKNEPDHAMTAAYHIREISPKTAYENFLKISNYYVNSGKQDKTVNVRKELESSGLVAS